MTVTVIMTVTNIKVAATTAGITGIIAGMTATMIVTIATTDIKPSGLQTK